MQRDTYQTVFVLAIVETVEEVPQDLILAPITIFVLRMILHNVDTA